MVLTQVAPADDRLLTLADVKADINVDTDAYDATLTRYIIAAEAYLDGRDGILGRCLRPQQWKLSLPGFVDCIRLPLPPTISVDLVEYLDDVNETLTTLATSQYTEVDGGFLGNKIIPADGVTYPNTFDRPDAVQITFTAGYQTAESPENEAVPENIRVAAMLLVKTWYDDAGADVPEVVKTLVAPYRLTHLG